MVTVLGLIGFGFGMYLGLIRFKNRREVERREKVKKDTSKGRKSRIDVSEDAPTELTPAELKAMGSWFKE
jgi:hypothetical protein